MIFDKKKKIHDHLQEWIKNSNSNTWDSSTCSDSDEIRLTDWLQPQTRPSGTLWLIYYSGLWSHCTLLLTFRWANIATWSLQVERVRGSLSERRRWIFNNLCKHERKLRGTDTYFPEELPSLAWVILTSEPFVLFQNWPQVPLQMPRGWGGACVWCLILGEPALQLPCLSSIRSRYCFVTTARMVDSKFLPAWWISEQNRLKISIFGYRASWKAQMYHRRQNSRDAQLNLGSI